MGTSRLVNKALRASSEEISAAAEISGRLVLDEKTQFQLRVLHASALSEREREDVWRLFGSNMRTLVEPSSFGWNPEEKKKELFHDDSRFVLVVLLRDASSSGATDSGAPSYSYSELAAFSMFRFEYEDGERLVYCYEMQVAAGFRNRGLGRFLMEKLTRIGQHWKMQKIVLTALKANTPARQFYAKVGFEMDPASPDYPSSAGEDDGDDENESDECDYEILFKPL